VSHYIFGKGKDALRRGVASEAFSASEKKDFSGKGFFVKMIVPLCCFGVDGNRSGMMCHFLDTAWCMEAGC